MGTASGRLSATMSFFGFAIAFIVGAATYAWFTRAADSTAMEAGDELSGVILDMAIGYDLLLSTLADEGQLTKLILVKRVTLSGPPKAVTDLMKDISRTALAALEQVENYITLDPPISPPPQATNFGHLLRASFKSWARKRLTSLSPQFPVRLLVIQAQALGMVRALAVELQKLDPNPERKAWLKEIETDFSQIRQKAVEMLAFTSGVNPAD